MRVLFAISTMTNGGAERVASILLREWDRRGVETILATNHRDRSAFFFDVPETVRHVGMDAVKGAGPAGVLQANARRWARLRRAYAETRPDIVVSFMLEMNVLALAAAGRRGPPIIVSERVHPQHICYDRARSTLRRRLYPRAAALVVQTEPIAEWFRAWRAGGATDAPIVTPNPVALSEFGAAATTARAPSARKTLVAVGRLAPQKGFDLLVEAFGRVAAERPEWDLEILGEGDARAELAAQIAQLGLEARVRLPGETADVAGALARADLYAHPARFEGYPNALIEALASGLPCVAADAPGGAAEILGGGRHGALVPSEDAAALADALRRLMGDAAARAGYAAGARAAVAHLDAPAIAERWLDLFERVAA